MSQIRSFPPLARPDALRLVLGSMPGRRSLDAQQYYAHPQNAFWKIFAHLLGFSPAESYERRCEAMRHARIAVWDVLATCTRTSSLDADIVAASIVSNDFAGFFATHSQIESIHFNGATAERLFCRHALPRLDARIRDMPRHRLPSTSPAHAGMSCAEKLDAWRSVLSRSHCDRR